MKLKASAIGQSLLWCLVILLFPVASGTLSVVLALDPVGTLFLQGAFMLASLIPPVVLVLSGRWRWREIGLAAFDVEGCKRALYFLPVFMIFVPAAVRGFYIGSTGYVLGNLFLYLFVGISEELYFRGIIPQYLKKEFSTRATVLLSTLIFGIGHMAAAFTGINPFEIMLVHFFFDFETKLAAMSGEELLIAEGVRGVLMFAATVWLTVIVHKRRHTPQAAELRQRQEG